MLPFGIAATSLGLAPTFIPLIDGLGLFGPPDPQGLLGPTGAKNFTFMQPIPPLGLTLQLQAYILDPLAPNLLVHFTNIQLLPL